MASSARLSLLTLQACAVIAAWAGAANAAPQSLYIIDANTGATLAAQDATEARYPASLTKMMTLYLAFDALERGKATMKTKIQVSRAATNAAPSKLELQVGDEITFEDAIRALITKSANDVAIAMAEHLGGSEQNFARMMTAKARDLGMRNTTFQNASGLPNPGQTTTARDMTTLGVRLYDDFPRYFPLFSTRAFNYNGSSHRNHNTLMLQMPGINGIKTGYTHASGFNLVSSLQIDGKHVIGAIFGGESAGSRNAQMRIALTRALAKASTQKTRRPLLVARAEAKRPAKVEAPPVKVAEAAPRPQQQPAPTSVKPIAGPSGPRIDVAKVRSVTVAEVTQPRQAGPVPQQQPQPQAVAQLPATPQPQPFAQAAMSAPHMQPRPAPVAVAAPAFAPETARQPSSFEAQAAGIGRNVQPVAQPQPYEPARPPSSLGAQMAALTGGAPGHNMAQPSYRLRGPGADPAASEPATGRAGPGFEIQVGAHASAADADRQLAQLQSSIPALRGFTPARRSIKLGDRMLHRARFAGFDQASAQATCAELIRQKINCLALKAD